MLRNILLTLTIAMTLIACSDNQGELVDKSQDPSSQNTDSNTQEQSNLPPDHPPISGVQGGASGMPSGGAEASLPQIEGNQVTVAGITFQIDTAWKAEQPSSSMRAAQFNLPAPEGSRGSAELALFQGIFGSADANIKRWIGQFVQPDGTPSSEAAKINSMKAGEFSVTTLDISGTFSAAPMMGGGAGPQENQRMLAAMIVGPGGPWQFKLIGPENTVTHWKAAFDKMLESLKPAS